MKATHAKRHLWLVLVLCLALLASILTVTAFAADRTNKFAKVNIVLNENIDILFWADIDESTAKKADTYVTFDNGSAVSSPVSYSEMKTASGISYAVYRYNDIKPQDMGKSVTAKLYVGGVLKDTQTYSVRSYAQYMLRYSASDALKTLVSDVLAYGAAAQTYLNKSPLVTEGVFGFAPSSEPTELRTLANYSVENNIHSKKSVDAKFKQVGLLLDNSIQMYFDVSIDSYDSNATYTAKLRIGGREEVVSLTKNDSYYRAVFSTVRASELFDIADVGIYKDDSRISGTAHYSVANYLSAQKDDATLASLVKAIYNYGISARRYVGNHVVTMPGVTTVTKTGTASKDPSGTVAYRCALCGETMGDIPVSHIRDFDTAHANNFGATSLTINTAATEGDNKYMSVLRGDNTEPDNTEPGKAKPSKLDYYFDINNSQTLRGTYIMSDSYTFEMDVRAPQGGLVASTIYMRNARTPSSGTGRYNAFLEINADGSLTNNGSAVAPAGTVNANEWTRITMMIELCEVNGEKSVYTEYYINGQLMSAVLIANTLGLDATVDGQAGSAIDPNGQYRFTDIYITASFAGLTAEDSAKGVEFDNFIFGQGAVHSFDGSVENYLEQKDREQMLEIVDLIEAEFLNSDYHEVITSTSGSSKDVSSVLDFTDFTTSTYEPSATPTAQHPRLLFNGSDIPDIVDAFEDEENSAAVKNFLNKVKTITDGKLSDAMNNSQGPGEYNYDANILSAIEAKALYYALFKNSDDPTRSDAVTRGYQAVYAIKNYLRTFIINYKSSDPCRLYGHVMYVSALVYDWCYDLLSEDDMLQIQLGVQNKCCDGTPSKSGSSYNDRKMEVGFPPLDSSNGLNNSTGTLLTGHNVEFQMLRDYFAFAIAIYDEVPSWYDYIGGMIEEKFVPTQNYLMECGYYPDGSAVYNMYRFEANLWCAWLYDGMNVASPYNASDMSQIIHGLISMETYGGNQFATGDGTSTTISTTVADCGLISSYLFTDGVARAVAFNFHNNYQSFYSSHNTVSAADYLILSGRNVETAKKENYQDNVKNVVYHDGWAQQVIARNNKSENSVVVLMQGGFRVPGGHTHQSAGSFQIYYKGQLTRDDGLYDSYSYDHHFFYHMSTVAHNSLLIYNSSYASDSDYKGKTSGADSQGKYLYNGGQRHWTADGLSSLPQTYESWITNNTYAYGGNIGMQTDSVDNPSYVYFANDITNAYHSNTVNYVERSINTVYTGDADAPMVMFVFDHIDADSGDFKKTFLLQCVTEPVVDTANKTVKITNAGGGMLVLTSLQGNDTIMAYGRTSKNGVVGGGDGSERFYLSGAQYNLMPGGAAAGSLSSTATDFTEMWGHVEISPNTGSKENLLMNVIYVTDSGKTVSATPTLVSGKNVIGATFMNYTSVFVSDPAKATQQLSFTSTGTGTQTYYVGGLAAGKWQVSIGGQSIGTYDVTADGRMLTFDGAVGAVTLTYSGYSKDSLGDDYTGDSSANVDLGSTLSTANNPVGELSFDVNVTATLGDGSKTSTMHFNNGSANVLDPFFTMTFTRSGSFLTSYTRTVTFTGWDGLTLATFSPSNNNFNQSFNLKIRIEAENGYVTLTYFIDGVYIGTATKQATADIAKIVASGHTGNDSKGVSLSNGKFYYTDMK